MEKIKAYGFMFLIYVVLYLNYIFGNENIQNITNVLLWIFVLLVFLVVIMNASSKDKTEQNNNKGIIEKTIVSIIFFGIPIIMLYFGDIFKGTMLLVSFIILKLIVSSSKKGK